MKLVGKALLSGALAGVAIAVTPAVASAGPSIAADTTPARSADASASVANEPPRWTPSGVTIPMACSDDNVVNGPGGTSVKNSIYLRTGPNAGCGNASGYSLPVGTRLGGWCYTYNESGNKWYYVSVGGAAPYGWIYSENVTSDQTTITTPCS